MNIPEEKNFFFRTAFRCSDKDHIPYTMRFIEILGLFVLNIVCMIVTQVIAYPIIFVWGYVFARRKREEREELSSISETNFRQMRRYDETIPFMVIGAWATSGIGADRLANPVGGIRFVSTSFGGMNGDTGLTVLIVVCLVIGYAHIARRRN
ncbi:MAG: hypothetical protein WCJ25_02445 [Candidatus Moraniibacteriota bacterium]